MFFKTEIVFVRILIPFLSGIFLAFAFPSALLKTLSFIALAVGLALVLLALSVYNRHNLYRYKTLISLSIFCLFFFFSIWHTLYHTDFLNDNHFTKNKTRYLKLVINNVPQKKGNNLWFEAKVIASKSTTKINITSGKILIALKPDSVKPINLNYGDALWVSADYTPIEPPYNPSEFNFKRFLANKNIYHQAFISQNNAEKVGQNQGNPLFSFAHKLRKKQVDVYRKLIKNDEAFAVASTLILGYRSDLSNETLDAYSKTGTIHALSVSGMHVGMIYFLLNSILWFCDNRRVYRIFKFLFIASLIWYYSLITGLAPPILRSAIMLTAIMIAKMLKRKPNNYNIVSATAFFILVYDPFLVWDVGFQLSFFAVFGLIYLYPKIYGWIFIKNKIGNKVWETIAISLAAQTATFPLSIYYFHQFPVYFVMANLLIFLPITLLMYLGLSIIIFKLYFLASVFEYIITQTNNALKQIADLPYASFSGIWINSWQLLLLAIAIFLMVFALVNFRKKLLFMSLLVLIVYLSSTFTTFIATKKQQKIVAYSLKKNYATAFINGNKAVLLTDLSTTDKNYRFYIKPSLEEMQIGKIKILSWQDDFKQDHFFKKDNQILFKNINMLLIDTIFNQKKILGNYQFDIVQISKNPNLNLNNIFKAIKTKKIWIDAGNKDFKMKYYINEIKKFNLEVALLKNNPAQIIFLKNNGGKRLDGLPNTQ